MLSFAPKDAVGLIFGGYLIFSCATIYRHIYSFMVNETRRMRISYSPFLDHSDVQLLFTESVKILAPRELRDSFLVFNGIAFYLFTHLVKIYGITL